MTDLVAHRGGALLWPENSATAFRNAALLAVEQVEFDVHLSRDRRLVVIHDATLERTTDGRGAVAEQDWAALAGLILKGAGGEGLPLLEEVIEIFRPTNLTLRLEIKPDVNRLPYPGLVEQVVTALGRADMLDRTVITSFQLETVCLAAHHGRPDRVIWVLTPEVLADLGLTSTCALAGTHRIPALALSSGVLDSAVLVEIRKSGLGIGAWRCNDAATIGRMLALEVDVLTTDRPDLAIRLRTERRASPAH